MNDAETNKKGEVLSLWLPWGPIDRNSAILERGSGYRVTDTRGRSYIDCRASSLNAICGYGVEALIEAAHAQMRKLPHCDLSVTSHRPALKLAERLAGLLPGAINHTLFVNSGSEAVEAALFIAWEYWKNIGEPRQGIVAFEQGYHGSTFLTKHLSGIPATSLPVPDPFPVMRIKLPQYGSALRNKRATEQLIDRFATALDARPAAVIVEPFINVGGGIVLPPKFLHSLQQLCDHHGVPLILDEVFCGFGRTGKMFGFEHDGIDPDIVVMSKGLTAGYAPLGAVSVTEKIFNSFRNEAHIGGLRYGHTTGGHAVACATALAVLDFIEERDLVANSWRLGEYLLAELQELKSHRHVQDVRGQGLVTTVELDDEVQAEGVVERASEEGLLLRRQGSSVMSIPPLTIDDSGIDEVVRLLRGAIHSTR